MVFSFYLFNQNTGEAIPGFPVWPGMAMEEVVNTPWFKYTINQNVQVGIVFNDNGGEQTDDLTRIKEGWYDNQWFDSCPNECPAPSEKPELTVTPDSNTAIGSVNVSMSATNSGVIFYTIGDAIPDANSIPYTNTFSINTLGIIKVNTIAINSAVSSNVVTKTYTITQNIMNYTVNFKKPNTWSTAYIYLFNKNTNTGLPGFPAWPGIQMSVLGTTPWYTYTIDQDVEVGIVFNDNGGSQSDDLFRTSDGWYDNQWTDACPSDCPDSIDISFKVYFKKSSTWGNAFMYIYDKNANAAIQGAPAWPGIPMTAISGTPWYSLSIDQNVEVGIVFNDNGGVQSDDLFRSTEGWYDSQWFDTCTSECPEGKVAADNNIHLVKPLSNPFNDTLTLSFFGDTNNNPVSAVMYTLNGKRTEVIPNKVIRRSTVTVDTSDVPKGMYMLKVISSNGTQIVKLIK